MSLGWTNAGVTGPITADATENLVWATGSGFLWGLDATTSAVAKKDPLALDGVQHFPTPNVVSNWVVIETSGRRVAGFPTPANPSGVAWTSVALDGEVQSRPAIVGTTVVVATENDSLFGLSLLDGHIIWGGTAALPTVHFGTPEPLPEAQSYGSVSGGCGNLNPLGVTSNLVYDPTTNRVFAVGERTTGTVTPHPPEHVLVGVDPATGSVTLNPANVDVPAMNGADGHGVARHQQRAGLVLANGNVYVGYGGLVGDCGVYHGFVVAASAANGQVTGSLEITANGNAGAVWATAGGTVDGSNNVYVATGNGFGNPLPTDYSDAVVKIAPSLSGAQTVPADYFQPAEWMSDNNADADLGSNAPVLLPNGTQLFIIGKQHNAFLLNTNALGGSDHNTPAARLNNACGGVADGQNAVIGSSAYIACSSGLRQIHLS